MLVLRALFLIVAFQFVAGQAEFRDDSGLFNVKEFSALINSLCDKVNSVASLLKSPFTLGVGKKLLSKTLPLPGPGILDPLHLIRFLVDKIEDLEDKLSSTIERRLEQLAKGEKNVKDEKESEESSEEKSKESDENTTKDPHYWLELGDLLAFAQFICKAVRLWNALINTPLADITGIAHFRIPIPDFKHKIDWYKALDLLDLEGIPHRIERIIDDEIITTTTKKPGFLESLFEKKTTPGTTTPKPPLFQRLLRRLHIGGSSTTLTTTARPFSMKSTTEKSFGFFGPHTTAKSQKPTTEKLVGGTTEEPKKLFGFFG